MASSLKIFGLLLYKNLIVRMRHWKLTLFVEVTLPIALFILTQAVRDFSVDSPKAIKNSTIYPKESQHNLTEALSWNLVNLYYYPNNSYTKGVMEATRQCLRVLPDKTRGFNSEEALVNTYVYEEAKNRFNVVMAVIFEDEEKMHTNHTLKYRIRHSRPIQNELFQDSLSENMNMAYNLYTTALPFVQLQMCLDESFINSVAKNIKFNTLLYIQKMPYPPYVKIDVFDTILRQIISVFAIIAFIIPLCIETGFAAKEKFIGVNVLMEMNGVRQYQNMLSWLLTGTIFSILYVIPIIVLFKNTFSPNVYPYLFYSNTFIFWLLVTAHVAHLITFGMHVAAYFSRPAFVITMLSIIYIASFSLSQNMIQNECYVSIPFLGILFPNMLFYRLLEECNAYEEKLIGLQWQNFFVVGKSQYTMMGSVGFIFFFTLIGTLLHFLLAIYINAILPGKYGVRKHPLYFLKCVKKNKVCLDDEAGDFDYGKTNGEDFEAVAPGVLTPGIQVRDLKKYYRTSWIRKSMVQALKGISVDFYKGQITAILGHNGAGKTTLMSILTGVISETAGKVFINGKNVKKDLQYIRNDLGLCPQENMVFPDLNVFEQIEFFGLLKVKNRTRKQLKQDVGVLLSKLKLTEKRNVLPSKLSGGQKRRLCLGMALIGDASTLILDEPTSGMDPETRRDTWDIILKMRGEKTILISTHNMEEADILGDRIAIVHGGRLKCYGTSMFLKKQYGQGHVEVTLSTKSWCNSDKVITKFDGKTQAIAVDSEKIILSVPYSDSLPDSLDKVESQKKKLGVTGISVSLITLEQVFLKVVNKEDDGKHLAELFMPQSEKLTGCRLSHQAVLALLKKKAVYTVKNPCNLFMTLILPIIPVVMLALSYSDPGASTEIIPLRLDMYRYPVSMYRSEHGEIGDNYKKVTEYFGGTAPRTATNESLSEDILKIAVEDIANYRNNYITAAEFVVGDNNTVNAVGLYSDIATHAIPLTVNLLTNTLLRTFVGDHSSIEMSRQQLPSSFGMNSFTDETEAQSHVFMFCAFFFSTVSLFVIHPLQETATKMKQLQRMTGVTAIAYWGTMFLFDIFIFFICVVCIMTGFVVMDVILDIRLYQTTEVSMMVLMLMLFGVNALLLVYIFSFTNKSRNTIMTILSLVPIGLVVIQYLLHEVILSFYHLRGLHKFQKGVFRLIPYVSFFHAQFAFYTLAGKNARCRRLPDLLQDVAYNGECSELECTNGSCKKPFAYFKDFKEDMSVEENVLYLGLTPILYFTILILLEEKVFTRLYSNIRRRSELKDGCDTMDEEVKKEKHVVALEISKFTSQHTKGEKQSKVSGDDENELQSPEIENSNLFLVYELSKYYGKLMAVKEVNFRVKQRECFGLLGVNGAGKSTTFRMLTGEEFPNSGSMYLKNANSNRNRKAYLSEMGYCPQTDALINSLNAFDHLRLFANLRGIPPSKVDLEVNKWINRLNLNACMKQPSGTYSGGNKRRLNIAMALIGNPTLVLLDEPTTGVDPAARRSLWNVLQSCQAAGQAIILTSHSMEECEALCNRLVIMVQGQLVCVGASQELKQRFGAGYDIHIKINPARSNSDIEDIKQIIESSLTCEIRDENLGFIAYHVSDAETTWKNMYSTMNNLKNRYGCIEDFAVLSATLEQLFIQFARSPRTRVDVPVRQSSQSVIV